MACIVAAQGSSVRMSDRRVARCKISRMSSVFVFVFSRQELGKGSVCRKLPLSLCVPRMSAALLHVLLRRPTFI